MEFHHGVVPPQWPARRRKSAKERCAQKLRATARAFQHVAQALSDVGTHRGGKLRCIGTRWHAHISAPHVSEIPMPRFLNLNDAVPSLQMAESARAVLVGVEPISTFRHCSAEVAHSSGTEKLASLPYRPEEVKLARQLDLSTLNSYDRTYLVEKIKGMKSPAIWRRFCQECPMIALFGDLPGIDPDYDIKSTPVADLRYFLLICQQYGYYGISEDKWYYSLYHQDVKTGTSRPFYPDGYQEHLISLS